MSTKSRALRIFGWVARILSLAVLFALATALALIAVLLLIITVKTLWHIVFAPHTHR